MAWTNDSSRLQSAVTPRPGLVPGTGTVQGGRPETRSVRCCMAPRTFLSCSPPSALEAGDLLLFTDWRGTQTKGSMARARKLFRSWPGQHAGESSVRPAVALAPAATPGIRRRPHRALSHAHRHHPSRRAVAVRSRPRSADTKTSSEDALALGHNPKVHHPRRKLLSMTADSVPLNLVVRSRARPACLVQSTSSVAAPASWASSGRCAGHPAREQRAVATRGLAAVQAPVAKDAGAIQLRAAKTTGSPTRTMPADATDPYTPRRPR
jgi:hypothetical protein